jgi:putative acetyltransferase
MGICDETCLPRIPRLAGGTIERIVLHPWSVIIRREIAEDHGSVEAVTSAAFAVGGSVVEPPETRLLRSLRHDSGWIPTLSMVAVNDEQIVGHVVCSRGRVGKTAALGLGPISVLPSDQRQGIGEAMMHAIVGAADAAGEPFIALLGDPHFYGRFGFIPASRLGIGAPSPEWGAHFQVRPLTAWPPSVTGTFAYAAPFASL